MIRDDLYRLQAMTLPAAQNIEKGAFLMPFTCFISVIRLTMQFCNAFMKL